MSRISPRLMLGLALAMCLFGGVLWYAKAPAQESAASRPATSGDEPAPAPEAAARPRSGAEPAPAAATPAQPGAGGVQPALPAGSGGGAAPAAPAKSAQPLDEAQLMAKLRSIKASDPAQAVELAREGLRRFPGTADAPERESIMIHALGALGRASEARGEAERMVNQYPDSAWVQDVERYTGAHRHRNVRLNDAGQLEFY